MTTREIYDTEESLVRAYAEFFVEKANYCIETDGRFNVALAGGSSPRRVYELLASSAFSHKVDWAKVFFFFGDERYVPQNDPQSNGLMADEALFTPLGIQDNQIFLVETWRPPEEAAKHYFDAISRHFDPDPIRFDLILLGLGDDGHTASLFPFTTILKAEEASVEAVFVKKMDVFRISMTAPLINMAENIAFLVFGEKKAEAVYQVIEGPNNFEVFPAQLIKAENGKTFWFLDKEAARLL